MKIARSQHLHVGTFVTLKHNKLVEYGENNWPYCVSNQVALPTSTTNSIFGKAVCIINTYICIESFCVVNQSQDCVLDSLVVSVLCSLIPLI